MPAAPIDFPLRPKTLNRTWLRIARLAWLVILLLTIGKIVLGMPLYFADLNQVCMGSEEVCNEGYSLTSREVAVLKTAGLQLQTYAKLELGWSFFTLIIWAGVGIFIFILRPNDWLALIASALLIIYNSSGYELQINSSYPALGPASEFLFNFSNALLFLFIGLFPNGRFSPRWMRWYWTGLILLNFLPLSTWVSPGIFNAIIVLFWVSFLLLGPYTQIYKYRNLSTTVERLQTKWIVLGFAFFAAAVLIGFSLQSLYPENIVAELIYYRLVFDFAGLMIPLSIGISILRYRLWDIDVVIRKTLQYSIVTGLLVLTYFGIVVMLQRILSPLTGSGYSPLIIVITTLAIAALFNPLRHRVQNDIDRRFFRKKYDAGQVLEQFAQSARDEVSLEVLTAELSTIIQDVIQPEKVTIWLRPK